MSGSVVLPRPGFVLMSMACDATRGHKNAPALGHHPWLCWGPSDGCCRAMLISVAYVVSQGHGVVWAQAAAEGPAWIRGPTAAMSMPPVTIKGYADAQGPGQHLRPC